MARIAEMIRIIFVITVRLLSSLCYTSVAWLSEVCCAAPQTSTATNNNNNPSPCAQGNRRRRAKVAVIGGGIAGTAAAWSLARSGKVESVTLFEPRPTLGGNAKTFLWHVSPSQGEHSSSSSSQVRTGLSVLAWPKAYFKNYELLLRELQIETRTVTPKFYVARSDGCTSTFRQGEENPQWREQQVRWDRAVACIRQVNSFCFTVSRWITAGFQCVLCIVMRLLTGGARGAPPRTGKPSSSSRCSTDPSFYEMTVWNPMNVIPARWFCRVFFGLDDAFWHDVVVPVYSSSFLTTRLDGLPCVILPALDDIISVGDADRLKPLETWAGSSKDVFDKMAREIGEENVLTSVAVDAVVRRTGGAWELTYRVASGSEPPQRISVAEKIARRTGAVDVTAAEVGVGDRHSQAFVFGNVWREVFDTVVFACPATAVKEMATSKNPLRDCSANQDVCPGDTSPFVDEFFERVMGGVRYENERDDNFLTGTIHAERGLVCPSAQIRQELFERRFTNYIQLHDDANGTERGGSNLENTFILGTWVPSAVEAAAADSGATTMSGSAGPLQPTSVVEDSPSAATNHATKQETLVVPGDCLVDSATPGKAKKRLSHQHRRRGKKAAAAADEQDSLLMRDADNEPAVEETRSFAEAAQPPSLLSDSRKGAAASIANTRFEEGTANMFVTYHAVGEKKRQLDAVSLGEVDNRWAHPQFTFASIAISLLIPYMQGTHDAFYCASYTTPGNGHDLSLLSGLAVAHEITGGYYPFSRTASASAKEDFVLLKRLLFGQRADVVLKDAAETHEA